MRKIGAALIFFGCSFLARAETSLDVLDRDLQDLATQRQAATSATMANFLAQLTAAEASPDAALALYAQAGGEMPLPTPVATDHVNETMSEREARAATDQATLVALGGAVQMQAGLMKQAAQLVLRPDDATVHSGYIAWLRAAALAYPAMMQSVRTLDPPPPATPGEDPIPHRRRHLVFVSTNPARRVVETRLLDSPISTYLGFTQWGTNPVGIWRVRDLAANYRSEVLEPQRTVLTPGVLVLWDTYVAMRVADGADSDELTFLAFQRAADAFGLSATVDKLSAAVALIRNNPTNSHSEEMIQRAQSMLAACKQRYEPGAAPTATAPFAPAPPTSPVPNVSTNEIVAVPQPDPPPSKQP